MATEDPMQLLAANGIRGGLGMASNGRSTGSTGLTSSSAQDSITQELGMLLQSHTRLDSVLSRRDPGSYRSGSAPPSVEGSLASIGGLFTNHLPGTGGKTDAESEQEIRSDPAYLVYYYSNLNLNPRLPPPLVTRDNYHLAQRLAGDKRTLKAFDEVNSRSLFSTQPSLPTHSEEPEFCEDDGHIFKQLHSEHLHFNDGLMGMPQGTRPKSLVDLIQEDFPRTPSPVFTQLRPSSRVANDENTGLDGQIALLRDSSVSAAAVAELNAALLGSRSATPNPILGSRSTTPNPLLSSRSTTPVPSLVNTTGTSAMTPGTVGVGKGPLTGVVNTALATELAASLQNLGLADQQRLQSQNGMNEDYGPPQLQLAAMPTLHSIQQHQHEKPSVLESSNRAQGKSAPLHPQSPITDSQPGTTSNLYAAAAAAATATAMSYMATNPYYSNLHSYSQPYNGYPMNPALFPSMMANYSSPMPQDNGAGVAAGMGIRTSLPPNGMGLDMQQLYKYCGQGSSPLPSQINDPLYYQYLQQYFGENCQNNIMPMDSLQGGYCMGSMEMQKSHSNILFGHHADQKSQFPRSNPYGVSMGSKNGSLSPSYYGSPPGVDFVLPYGNFPISSSVLPGTPVHHGGFSARQGDRNFRLPSNTTRTTSGGPYMGWPGQKAGDVGEELKTTSLLDELKNNKARRFELPDILGHVVEFSADQHGSRFIQQKLETVSLEEKAAVFEEVLPHSLALMTDVFGNYVIQKFFEHGSPVQRSELASKVVGHVLSLSLQMYGCRVIQKALEVLDVEQQIGLIAELDGQVMRCVRDQNGNHVIQKCIECVPPQHINFILSAFHGQIVMLSTHPYGCRVIQRVLEHCTEEQKQNGIMEEILRSVCILAQDQYGNYVVQHILEHGKPEERSEILTKMAGQIVQMSQHKFASNVVEKCLEFSGPAERQILITEMLGQTDENEPLQAMMKDQFANYVVQKVLETCDDQQREMLLSRIRVHLHGLKKYTYGKHIVARVEKLVAAGERRGAIAASMTTT